MRNLFFVLALLLSISAAAQTTRSVTVAINQNMADCSITGLPENRSQSFYPNPASTTVTIGSLRENSEITIFDTSGKQISAERIRISAQQLDVRPLNDGLYLLRIKHAGVIDVIKIMVQHK